MLELRFWGEGYLLLLTKYRFVVEEASHEIHRLDPGTIFSSRDYDILSRLEETGAYDRQTVLSEVDLFESSSTIPAFRHLPQFNAEEHAFFFVLDKTRGMIIAMDSELGLIPRVYCQETSTGRKLPPLVDLEFVDNQSPVIALGAKLSHDAKYIGIVLSWVDDERNTVYYTAIWKLEDHVSFEPGLTTAPWAHKHISITSTSSGESYHQFTQVLAFDDCGYVLCPNGRISLLTGTQHISTYLQAEESSRGTTIFCDDGSVMLVHNVLEDSIAVVDSLDHAVEVSIDWNDGLFDLMCVSRAGRYIIVSGLCSCRLATHDYRKGLTANLEGAPMSFLDSRFQFSADETLLYGMFTGESGTRGLTSRVYVWTIHDSLFILRTTKTIQGDTLAWQLDPEEGVLHIVTDGRIWSRLQLTGLELGEIDTLPALPKYGSNVQEVAADGTLLAVLYFNPQEYVINALNV